MVLILFTHIVIESDPCVDGCGTPPSRGIDGGPPLPTPDRERQIEDATWCADDDLSGWSAITRLFVENVTAGDMNQLRAALRRFASELEVRPVDWDGTGSASDEPADEPGTLDPDVGLLLDAYLDVEGGPPVLTENAPYVLLRQLIDEAIAEVQRDPRVPEPQPMTGASDNADAPPKTAPPTPNERRVAQLEELLDAAKKTGNADALVEAFSKKLGLLSDGQYSTFRTQVKKAMEESELYIDLRAMDRVRKDAKKRIDGQITLMKKVDEAFNAGRSTIIASNRLCGAPHNPFNAESIFMRSDRPYQTGRSPSAC